MAETLSALLVAVAVGQTRGQGFSCVSTTCPRFATTSNQSGRALDARETGLHEVTRNHRCEPIQWPRVCPTATATSAACRDTVGCAICIRKRQRSSTVHFRDVRTDHGRPLTRLPGPSLLAVIQRSAPMSLRNARFHAIAIDRKFSLMCKSSPAAAACVRQEPVERHRVTRVRRGTEVCSRGGRRVAMWRAGPAAVLGGWQRKVQSASGTRSVLPRRGSGGAWGPVFGWSRSASR